MKTKNYISKIFVEDLFGYYTYTIPSSENDIRQLMILYGDNGTGKTTILELIFYLLSSIESAGHKTNIANIKFTQFNVTFRDTTEIIALREKPGEGSFKYIIKKNGKTIYELFLKADAENSIKLPEGSAEDIKLMEMYKYLDDMNVSISFLSDDRKILYSLARYYERPEERYFRSRMSKKELEGLRLEGLLPRKRDQLALSIEKLENKLRKQALTGSRQGEKSSNAIYDDIVNSITRSRKKKNPLSDENVQTLKNQLNDIKKVSQQFAEYGLISKVNVTGVEKALSKAKGDKLQIIFNIIEPYIKGINAKLKSLSNVQELILSFIHTLNSYFTNKRIHYHLAFGFKIVHEYTKETIPIEKLSSGEKQLLLLLCNIITAGDEVSIFVIDEPELSLNVKWQRELLETLLKFGSGRNVQFIIATHSIELLTKHYRRVNKLVMEKK